MSEKIATAYVEFEPTEAEEIPEALPEGVYIVLGTIPGDNGEDVGVEGETVGVYNKNTGVATVYNRTTNERRSFRLGIDE